MSYGSMNVTITLVKVTPGSGSLSPAPTRTTRDVFASVESVWSTEFWRADANGKKLDVVFNVVPDEYDEEAEVQYNGKTYSVVRSGMGRRGYWQLFCARR